MGHLPIPPATFATLRAARDVNMGAETGKTAVPAGQWMAYYIGRRSIRGRAEPIRRPAGNKPTAGTSCCPNEGAGGGDHARRRASDEETTHAHHRHPDRPDRTGVLFRRARPIHVRPCVLREQG